MTASNPIAPELGKTMYDGQTPDANNLAYVSSEGMEMWHDNFAPAAALTKTERNQKKRKARLIRWMNATAAQAGDVVVYQADKHGLRCDALSTEGAEFAGVIDENLPSTGCVQYDLCWLFIEGETLVNKDTGAFTDGDILQTGDSGQVKVGLEEISIPLTSGKVHDAMATDLPAAAAADDMGLVTGTPGTDGPTLQGVDFGGTSTDEKASFEIILPEDYKAATNITLRVRAAMLTTVSDGTATVDAELWKADEDGAVGSDLCATAAVSINSLTRADVDFTITGTTLNPGDKVILRLSFAGSDTGNLGVMIPEISKVSMLMNRSTLNLSHVGRVVADAASGDAQVLAHVKSLY